MRRPPPRCCYQYGKASLPSSRAAEPIRGAKADELDSAWWADLPDPTGSEPGFRRPVVVVQSDAFNRSRIATVVCVPLTSSLRWADAPGNVLLRARSTGLPRDSVANVSQIVAIDRASLSEPVGKLSTRQLQLVLAGIDAVLGR